MNKYRILFPLVAMVFLAVACADESLAPVVTVDSAGYGAYPRINSDSGTKLVNLYDVASSSYTYDIEFVDLERGKLISEYYLTMEFDDNDPSNGDLSKAPAEFRRWSASDFSVNENGYMSPGPITITAQEALSAAGVTADQVSPGDRFRFRGTVVLMDGATFSSSNSSSAITSSSFRGFFDFDFTAQCPSDLSGSYAYVTSGIWCDTTGTQTLTGSVNIVEGANGEYKFSDWSFGTYDGVCYKAGTSPPGGSLEFTDKCNVVSFTGFKDDINTTWSFDSSINGEEWTIVWSNDFGESGTTVITFPGGVPFSL